MALVWRTSGNCCGICAGLDGTVDGQLFDSRNGPEVDLYELDERGEHYRRRSTPGQRYGSPPLHPNCQCSLVEETAESFADRIT